MTVKTNIPKIHRAWIILVGCSLMTAGTCGMLPILGSLFYVPVTTELGVSIPEMSFYPTLFGLVQAFMLPIVGQTLAKTKRLNLLLSACTIIAGLSFAMMSLYTKVWMWCVSGVVMGMSIAFTSFMSMTIIVKNWFAKRTGLALGISWSVFSITTAVVSPIFSNLIQTVGWRASYVIVAAISVIIVLPFTLFVIKYSPESVGELPYGYEEKTEEAGEEAEKLAESGVPYKIATRSASFFILVLAMGLMAIVTSLYRLFPVYAESVGFAAQIGALMISASMIADVFLNLFVGTACDKMGLNRVFALCIILTIVSHMMLMFSAGNVGLALSGAAVNDILYSFEGTGMALLVASQFGNKDFNRIYPLLSSVSFYIGCFGNTILSSIYAFSGSFRAVFIFCAVTLVIVWLLTTLSGKMAARLPHTAEEE